jgi:hypothetical protein
LKCHHSEDQEKEGRIKFKLNYKIIVVGTAVSCTHKLGVLAVKMNIYRAL